MTIVASKKGVYPKAQKSLSEEEQRVRDDIYGIIDLVSKSQGYSVDKNSLPEVVVDSDDISGFDRTKNVIQISKDKIGRGATYAAEVGHFLRDYATGKIKSNEPVLDLNEMKTHEFFDRATYHIARKLSQGTDSQHLFDTPDIDYSSKEGRKKLADLGQRARSLLKLHKNDRDYNYRGWAESEAQQFKSHTSYALADKYSADDFLGLKNFYSMPDEEVQRKFLRKGSLETKVAAAAVVGLVSGAFFLSSNLTGNVIGLSNATSSWIGGILILIGLIALGFWIKSKRKV